MKEVPLTHGKVALVDDKDYDRVMQFKWSASWRITNGEKIWIAQRSGRDGGRTKTTKLHRFILDAPAHLEVDHKNHNPLDCQRHNMRLATHAQNACNRRPNSRCKSGFKGVSDDGAKYRKSWRVTIDVDGRRVRVGRFPTVEAAARAYDAKAKEVFGEFAWLNFPNE